MGCRIGPAPYCMSNDIQNTQGLHSAGVWIGYQAWQGSSTMACSYGFHVSVYEPTSVSASYIHFSHYQ